MTKEQLYRTIGVNLKSIVVENNISLTQLYQLTGIDVASLSRYFNGKTNTIPLYNVYLLSQVLGVSIDDLCRETFVTKQLRIDNRKDIIVQLKELISKL